MKITPRKKRLMDFINSYSKRYGFAPSIPEIAKRFNLAVSTVHQHLSELEAGGHLKKEKNQPRTVEVSRSERMVRIPLLGLIAAGQPIEVMPDNELIAVPENKIPKGSKVFALQVAGQSMIDEGVNDGDIILVKQQSTANNGDKVVALVNENSATLKKYYKEKGKIRLQPANKELSPILISRDKEIAIQGVLLEVLKTEISERVRLPLNYPIAQQPQKTKLPINEILCGDVIKTLKTIPDNSVDMTFADPPFNLNKKYGKYKDRKAAEDYLDWSAEWLAEMVRVTKPTGSIFVHNIPKWLIPYGVHLNKIAYFKHWIAWDSMSTPLGKTLLPAHYGILFYTKQPQGFKFNELRAPHKRCRSCDEMIKDYGGKKAQINPHGTLLSDVWADIHRIRHASRRDEHPCQLPEPLLERLILMSTNEGDVVLDPFIGAGTTALAAKRLGRNFVGIDIDPQYESIVKNKLKQVKYRKSDGYSYNGNSNKKTSKYLKNLTISEKEGIYPIK